MTQFTRSGTKLGSNGPSPFILPHYMTYQNCHHTIEGIVKLLLENFADVNAKNGRSVGITVLEYATQNGLEEMVKLLLEYSADVNVKHPYSGRTPLMHAAWKGYEGIVKLLLEKSADANIKDKSGSTAYDLAINNGHVGIAQLISAEAAEAAEHWVCRLIH